MEGQLSDYHVASSVHQQRIRPLSLGVFGMGSKSAVLLGMSLSLLPACNGVGTLPTLERTSTDTTAIQGGLDDRNGKYPFAVGLYSNGGICSGALIAPNLVLTARHCVADSPEAVECDGARFGGLRVRERGGLEVTTGSNLYSSISRNSGVYTSRRIITPTESALCGNDIALVILDRNVPASEATPVIPAVNPGMTDSRYSKKVTAIGYGVTSPGNDSSAGLRRIRENIELLCVGNAPDIQFDCLMAPNIASQMTEKEFLALEGTCQGDSGSSAFEQTSFAAWKAGQGTPVTFGVLSRGGEQDGKCMGAIYTRTDVYSDFLIGVAKQAAALGGYPVPAWTSGSLGPNDQGRGPVAVDAGTKATDESASPSTPEQDSAGNPSESPETAAKGEPPVSTTNAPAAAPAQSGEPSQGCSTGPSKGASPTGLAFVVLGLASLGSRRRRGKAAR